MRDCGSCIYKCAVCLVLSELFTNMQTSQPLPLGADWSLPPLPAQQGASIELPPPQQQLVTSTDLPPPPPLDVMGNFMATYSEFGLADDDFSWMRPVLSPPSGASTSLDWASVTQSSAPAAQTPFFFTDPTLQQAPAACNDPMSQALQDSQDAGFAMGGQSDPRRKRGSRRQRTFSCSISGTVGVQDLRPADNPVLADTLVLADNLLPVDQDAKAKKRLADKLRQRRLRKSMQDIITRICNHVKSTNLQGERAWQYVCSELSSQDHKCGVEILWRLRQDKYKAFGVWQEIQSFVTEDMNDKIARRRRHEKAN